MWQWELSVSKTHISISTRNEWICRNQYNWEKKTQCSRFYLRAKNFFIAHCYWKHWFYILLFCLIMWLNIVLKRTYVGSVAVNEIFVAQPEWKLSEEWLKSYLSSGGYKSAGIWKQAGGCCWPPDNRSPVTLAKIFTFGP